MSCISASTCEAAKRRKQLVAFSEFDTEQHQRLRPHPQPLSQAGFIF